MKYEYYDNWNMTIIAIIGIAFFLIAGIAMFLISKYEKEEKTLSAKQTGFTVFLGLLALGLAIRWILAFMPLAHADLPAFFIPWTNALMENPLSDFYFLYGDVTVINALHDYTPLYMYVLSFIGFIVKTFNINYTGMLFLQKLPSIICDCVATYFIFKTAKHFSKKDFYCYAIALLYFLCPAVIVDSAIWGQVDGITAMFFIIVFYFMVIKKDAYAIFFSIVGLCFKLQFIFVAPAVGIYYLFRWFKHHESIKPTLIGLGFGVLFFIAINIPFTYKIVLGGDYLFPFKIYLNQVGNYSYYMLNSFNLYGVLKLNFVELPADSIYSVINAILILFPCLISVGYFAKKRELMSVPLLAAFVISFVFIFSFKMHERYMFGAIIAMIVLLSKKFDWLLFTAMALISLNVFINIATIMAMPGQCFNYADERLVIGGYLGLVAMATLIAYMIKTFFAKNDSDVTLDAPKDEDNLPTEVQSEIVE